MKKCFYFPTWEELPTWEEQKDVIISLGNENIYLSNLIAFQSGPVFKKIEQSIPTDETLKKLCGLTGAKMYGDYVMLKQKRHRNIKYLQGDILTFETAMYCLHKSEGIIMSNNHDDDDYNVYDLKQNCFFKSFDIISNLSNIFQEYSKFLRKEENKWEDYYGVFHDFYEKCFIIRNI